MLLLKAIENLKREKKIKSIRLPEDILIKIFEGVFLEVHNMIKENNFDDGTAAIVVLVEKDNNRLIIANSGDQRAVLARGDRAIQITEDHKPDNPSELLRIQDCGGFVNETKRVDGILALSRALGDSDLQPHVTYQPEVFFVDLVPEDKFLIIACDGLWDVLTNEQAVSIISDYTDAAAASAALRDHAHCLGSTDNISVMVYIINAVFETSHYSLIKSRGRGFSRKDKKRSKSRSKSKSRTNRIKTIDNNEPPKEDKEKKENID